MITYGFFLFASNPGLPGNADAGVDVDANVAVEVAKSLEHCSSAWEVLVEKVTWRR